MSPVDQFPGNIFFLFYRRLIFSQEIRKKEEFQDEENNEEFDQDNPAREVFPASCSGNLPGKNRRYSVCTSSFSMCLQVVSVYHFFPESESDILFLII